MAACTFKVCKLMPSTITLKDKEGIFVNLFETQAEYDRGTFIYQKLSLYDRGHSLIIINVLEINEYITRD